MDIIRYESRKSTDLTEADIRACSDLFSTSYGMYDMNSPIRPGEQVPFFILYGVFLMILPGG